MARRRTFFQKQDGSVILETALMLTVLLIVTFGMVDFGRVMYTSNSLISAAREGARFGAVVPLGSLKDSIPRIKAVTEARFNQYTFGGDNLADSNVVVDTSIAPTPAATASQVKVTINYPFKWISPVQAIASIIAKQSV